MRKITPLFGIAFKQTCTCTSYRTRLRECLVFWSTVFTPAIARKLMFKTFIFSTKCGVFSVEMYYVNSFKDIIYKKKKERKIDRSISITNTLYKCFDIVKMFHGL